MDRNKRRELVLGSEDGAELIEFAMTLPLLLLVTLAIVDFGIMFHRGEVLTNSVREGARIAIQTGTSQSQIQNRVTEYVQNDGGVPVSAGNPAVTVTNTFVTTPSGSWSARTVNVSYTHDYLFLPYVVGWFGGAFNQTTLQAQATMRFLAPSG